MSGVFHIVSGTIAAFLIWKVAGKRCSLGLMLVFIVNSYFGPDLRGAIKPLAKVLQSPAISHFAVSIHTYLGWVAFSLVWAPLFYGILKILEHNREKQHIPQIRHDYKDVLLATISGGLIHLFIDTFGNLARGQFFDSEGSEVFFASVSLDLMVLEWDVFVLLGILAIFTALVAISIGLSRKGRGQVIKEKSKSMVQSTRNFFSNKSNLVIFLVFGIIVANALAMVAAQAWGGFDFTWYREDRKTGYFATIVIFDLGNALEATKSYTPLIDISTTFSAIAIIAFIMAYIVVHVKGITMNLFGRERPGEIIVIILFVLIVIGGYLLQPIIGNISGSEADIASFLYFWGVVLTPLVIWFGIDLKKVEN